MKNLNFRLITIHFILMSIFLFSCKKEDAFLAAIPNQTLAIPKSLKDLDLLLQNDGVFNTIEPSSALVAGEQFSTTDAFYQGLSKSEQNVYIWAKKIYAENESVPDWTYTYLQVYYANTILDYLPKVNDVSSQPALYNQIKGSALFFRAKAYFNLMQIFTLPYNPTTASSDLGVPLRLTSDLNAKVNRATQQQCYDQILKDLQESIQLLPLTSANITQPTNIAAYGFLARVYLSLGKFQEALNSANAFLAKFNTLTDYNTLAPATPGPISNIYLSEDVFHSTVLGATVIDGSRKIVDPQLYASYDVNDLRKSVYFGLRSGRRYFNGTYDINRLYLYTGIATDEIYLIRSESFARNGNTVAAMTDLNTLLKTRWKSGTFVPYTANNADDALKSILSERDKELLYRGLRWYDLRRLNSDSRFAKTLSRTVLGVTYTLPPNDPRYAFPIPDQEIILTGIPQNIR